MKKFTSIIVLSFLISCSGIAQKSEKKIEKKYTIEKTASEWKKQLNSLQYYVLREAGTERPFTSPLNENKKVGIYVCAACETPLYDSSHKFDSGTGWPSFDRAIINNNLRHENMGEMNVLINMHALGRVGNVLSTEAYSNLFNIL